MTTQRKKKIPVFMLSALAVAAVPFLVPGTNDASAAGYGQKGQSKQTVSRTPSKRRVTVNRKRHNRVKFRAATTRKAGGNRRRVVRPIRKGHDNAEGGRTYKTAAASCRETGNQAAKRDCSRQAQAGDNHSSSHRSSEREHAEDGGNGATAPRDRHCPPTGDDTKIDCPHDTGYRSDLGQAESTWSGCAAAAIPEVCRVQHSRAARVLIAGARRSAKAAGLPVTLPRQCRSLPGAAVRHED